MSTAGYLTLPPDLPPPDDDGAARHLDGATVPPIALAATDGTTVTLGALPGCSIVYAYPMTGRPGVALPAGWDAIPGARGCTPESCGFRDHHAELHALGARVFGLSTQDTPYQQEVQARLSLPFPLLSDRDFALTRALELPTLVVDGAALLKRLTLVIRDGRVDHVFYPVFPPDTHAAAVVAWLRQRG